MAVTPTITQVPGSDGDNSAVLFTWVLTTANPLGTPVDANHLNLHNTCITAQGTWGGATMSWQGGNDGTNVFTCSNVAGSTAATLTANGGMEIIERPIFIGPNLTTVGSGASVTVTALLTRNQPGRK